MARGQACVVEEGGREVHEGRAREHLDGPDHDGGLGAATVGRAEEVRVGAGGAVALFEGVRASDAGERGVRVGGEAAEGGEGALRRGVADEMPWAFGGEENAWRCC